MKASKLRNRLRNERKAQERYRKRLSCPVPGRFRLTPQSRWQKALMKSFGATEAYSVVDADGHRLEFCDKHGQTVAISTCLLDWTKHEAPPEGSYVWAGPDEPFRMSETTPETFVLGNFLPEGGES